MKLRELLATEVKRSDGEMTIESVADDGLPSAKTSERIEREIAAQISANEAMSSRSMQYASSQSVR